MEVQAKIELNKKAKNKEKKTRMANIDSSVWRSVHSQLAWRMLSFWKAKTHHATGIAPEG